MTKSNKIIAKTLTIFTCINYSLIVLCQNPYDFNYKFSKEIYNSYAKHKFNELSSWELSYIGEYESSLKMWDNSNNTSYKKDSLLFKSTNFMFYNALDYITEKSKFEQIIIINEAHHQPYHRIFTTKLLKNLFANGFRYLGAEAIFSADLNLNNRKYPTFSTGSYTIEPTYANLIREALKIGFEVFSYETTRSDFDSAGINLREIDQAMNIKKILDKDKNAKIFIHCGFDHIIETDYKGWGKAMAGRLYELTNINPLTIDQVTLTEKSTLNYDNCLFKLFNLNNSSIILDTTIKKINSIQESKKFDISIYHPRTNYINGRPNWIFDSNRKPYYLDSINLSFPCLIFAVIESELNNTSNPSDDPIPFDIIEIKNKNDKIALSLINGNYIIYIKDSLGNTQKQKISIK